MSSFAGSEFEKKLQCPTSEVLLSYQQRDLNYGRTSQIASHLAECDFCAAELQLLSKYSPAKEPYECPSVPVSLRALAEGLFAISRFGEKDLLERAFGQGSQSDIA
jgi:hypothetical protein